MKDTYPEFVPDDDAKWIDAVIALVWAAVEATKADGTSVTLNRKEEILWRRLFRTMGYGRDQTAALFAAVESRIK